MSRAFLIACSLAAILAASAKADEFLMTTIDGTYDPDRERLEIWTVGSNDRIAFNGNSPALVGQLQRHDRTTLPRHLFRAVNRDLADGNPGALLASPRGVTEIGLWIASPGIVPSYLPPNGFDLTGSGLHVAAFEATIVAYRPPVLKLPPNGDPNFAFWTAAEADFRLALIGDDGAVPEPEPLLGLLLIALCRRGRHGKVL